MTITIWPSATRIIATFLVFLYHYLSLKGVLKHYPELDKNGYTICALFLFISGYYSNISKYSPHKWIVKRTIGILIPYWIIIIPVLAANAAYLYKPALPWEYAVILLGGSMFLANPVYVISWFITLIIILYLTVYLTTIARGAYKAVPGVCCFLLLHTFLHMADVLFFSFAAGYLLNLFTTKEPAKTLQDSPAYRYAACKLFAVQAYCYSFFLIHGAVLIVATKLFAIHDVVTPVAAIAVTVFLSVFHKRVSDALTSRAYQMLNLTGPARPAQAPARERTG
jgi:hypothetical protein